jgi:hypothetical protein
MGETDDLKETLRRLQRACAEVQKAIEETLKALDGGPSSLPAPAEGPAAPPPPPPEDPRLARLRKFAEAARASGLDPADTAFADRAPERFRDLPEEKRTLLLGECARLMDDLLWKYHFLLPAALRTEGAALTGELAASLPPRSVESLSVPADAPRGTVVSQISPWRRAVSSGRSSPAAEALIKAARGVSMARASPAARGQVLSEIMKTWLDMAAADPQKNLLLLRYAVNAFDEAGVPAVEPLLEALEREGIREVPVAAGAPFDEGYSPSQFERRSVASDAERHRIVRVRQRCFVGPDGNPLQKGIIEVSEGKS